MLPRLLHFGLLDQYPGDSILELKSHSVNVATGDLLQAVIELPERFLQLVVREHVYASRPINQSSGFRAILWRPMQQVEMRVQLHRLDLKIDQPVELRLRLINFDCAN